MINYVFNRNHHRLLSSLFRVGYSGYKPDVREAPNGDGVVDADKRFLHVALKYKDRPDWATSFLARAHHRACEIAEALRVPDHMYPRVENSTLRVLEYPIGAVTARHCDFDLFTFVCWRSHPEDLYVEPDAIKQLEGRPDTDEDAEIRALAPGLHVGEIGELVGLGDANEHWTNPRPYAQQSIVYFAMPANGARFDRDYVSRRDPSLRVTAGTTVKDWLGPRYAASRVYVGK